MDGACPVQCPFRHSIGTGLMRVLLIPVCLLPLVIGPYSTTAALGGGPCGLFHCLKGHGRRVEYNVHCHFHAPQCDGARAHKKQKKYEALEPPRGMVVQSVPALLVAEQAIAVRPAAFRAHALACDQEAAMAKFAEAFAEKLAERQAGARAACRPQAEGHPQSPEERIEALERQLDRIEELMRRLDGRP
jgi:hypothetical protein